MITNSRKASGAALALRKFAAARPSTRATSPCSTRNPPMVLGCACKIPEDALGTMVAPDSRASFRIYRNWSVAAESQNRIGELRWAARVTLRDLARPFSPLLGWRSRRRLRRRGLLLLAAAGNRQKECGLAPVGSGFRTGRPGRPRLLRLRRRS